MRILLDPTGVDGGSTPPEAQAPPAQVAPPPLDAKLNPGIVQVSRADLEADREELKTLRQANADRERAANEEKEKRLKDNGKWEEVVRMRDEAAEKLRREVVEANRRAEEVQKATASYVLGDSLSRAIANRTDLAEGAAELLTLALTPNLEARNVNGQWVVATVDGKSPADYLSAYLDQPRSKLLLKGGIKAGPNVSGATAGGAVAAPTDPRQSDYRARVIAAAAAYRAGNGSVERGVFDDLPPIKISSN